MKGYFVSSASVLWVHEFLGKCLLQPKTKLAK